jgi:WD40 repeat protein
MFEASSGKPLETIRHTIGDHGQRYDSRAESIVFRSNRLELISGWSDPFICATSLEGEMYTTLATAAPPNHHIEALDLSADESLVAAASTNLPWVWLLDSDSLQLRFEIKVNAADRVEALDCSPVGKRLAVGTRNNLVVLIDDWQKPQDQHVLPGHSSVVASVSFGYQGQVLASGDWDGNVVLWDVVEKSEKTGWKFPGRIWKLAFAPDGRHLIVGDGTGKVYVLRTSQSVTVKNDE